MFDGLRVRRGRAKLLQGSSPNTPSGVHWSIDELGWSGVSGAEIETRKPSHKGTSPEMHRHSKLVGNEFEGPEMRLWQLTMGGPVGSPFSIQWKREMLSRALYGNDVS